MEFSLKELVQILNGRLYNDENIQVHGVEIDSRRIKKGDVFFAIKREKDGHDYIHDAFNKGAVAFVVERPVNTPFPYIIVDNTFESFLNLAKYARYSFKGTVLGITGSFGKTTTREMLYKVLAKDSKEVFRSEKNFNNIYGVSLTLLNNPYKKGILIVEMGISEKGEMDRLIDIVEPDIGIVTGVGSVHAEGLGDKTAIAEEKVKILKNGGSINADDAVLRKYVGKDIIGFGLNYGTFRPEAFNCSSRGCKFWFNQQEYCLNSFRKGILRNAFGVMSLLVLLGKDIDKIRYLRDFKLLKGRGQILRGKFSVIDDSYNASVESILDGLESLFYLTERKICVLAPMLELGVYEKKMHKEVSSYAAQYCDKVIFIDKKGIYPDNGKSIHVKDINEAYQWLRKHVKADDYIYIKGSHAFNLNELIELLKEEL